MGRVVKLADVRRSEFVDCAQTLFLSKGYENTTVADIIERAGSSKGGFYHHFASKEDLLDAFTDKISREIIVAAQDVLEDENLDALTRLNRFFVRGQQWKVQAAPQLRGVYSAMFKRENALLYQRMVRVAFAALAPVLLCVIEQGIDEGTFDAPDAQIAAEILLHLSNSRHAIVAEAMAAADRGEMARAVETLEQRIRMEEAVVDRMLGLPKGSVRLVEPGFIRAALTAFRQT